MLYWYPNKEKIEEMVLDEQPRMRYAVYKTADFKSATYKSSGQVREFCEKVFVMLYSESHAENSFEHYILVDWTPGEPEIDWPADSDGRRRSMAALKIATSPEQSHQRN